MYQSIDETIKSLNLFNESRDLISDAVDTMVRDKQILDGITPIEEEIDPVKYRTLTLLYLKRIAKKPLDVYRKLFDLNELEEYVNHAEEFNKHLKYRRNLETDYIIAEWNRYLETLIKRSLLPIKDADAEILQKYDELHNINRDEDKLRANIIGAQRTAISRLKKKIENIKNEHNKQVRLGNENRIKELEDEEDQLREEIKEEEDTLRDLLYEKEKGKK
jgi:uncharacterized protein Yka (UPF0111/DUF47 family)